MKISYCEKEKKLEKSLTDKTKFIPTIVRAIYHICENDTIFRNQYDFQRKKKIQEKQKLLGAKLKFIEKLKTMQDDTSKKLKILDIENTSKIEDLLYRIGGA